MHGLVCPTMRFISFNRNLAKKFGRIPVVSETLHSGCYNHTPYFSFVKFGKKIYGSTYVYG